MRVLALGDKSQLSKFFPDGIELVNEGPFDNIFLGSHLQIVHRQHVTQVLSKLRNELVSGGHIIATVPSLEWACREIATKDADLGLGPYLSIYGTETEEHKCGFTMPWLRLCFEVSWTGSHRSQERIFHIDYPHGRPASARTWHAACDRRSETGREPS